MRIVEDEEWLFYDPELDERLENLKSITSVLSSAEDRELYGFLLDADVELAQCRNLLSCMITNRHAVSLIMNIQRALSAMDAFRVEDLVEMHTVIGMTDEYTELLESIIGELRDGPGSVFKPVQRSNAA